jgi:hypothetical protein
LQKKANPSKEFALLKNDITGSEPTVKMLDTLQKSKVWIIKKQGQMTLPILFLVELVGFEPTTHRLNRLALPTELQPRACYFNIGFR